MVATPANQGEAQTWSERARLGVVETRRAHWPGRCGCTGSRAWQVNEQEARDFGIRQRPIVIRQQS